MKPFKFEKRKMLESALELNWIAFLRMFYAGTV